MKPTFTTTRQGGRSDRRVIYEMAAAAQAVELLTYTALQAALQEGVQESVALQRVQSAARAVNKLMLKDGSKKYLVAVPNEGYRVLRADEHLPVAMDKKDRAHDYLARGRAILENTPLDELTETQRKLHEGQLMILSGLIQTMRDQEKRARKRDDLLAGLVKRVEKLESGDTTQTG